MKTKNKNKDKYLNYFLDNIKLVLNNSIKFACINYIIYNN